MGWDYKEWNWLSSVIELISVICSDCYYFCVCVCHRSADNKIVIIVLTSDCCIVLLLMTGTLMYYRRLLMNCQQKPTARYTLYMSLLDFLSGFLSVSVWHCHTWLPTVVINECSSTSSSSSSTLVVIAVVVAVVVGARSEVWRTRCSLSTWCSLRMHW